MPKILLIIFTLSSNKNTNYDIGFFSHIKNNDIAFITNLNYEINTGLYAQIGVKIYARDFIVEVGCSTNKLLNLKLEIDFLKKVSFYIQAKISHKTTILGIGLSFIENINKNFSIGFLLEGNIIVQDEKYESKTINQNLNINNLRTNEIPQASIKEDELNKIEKIKMYNFNELTSKLNETEKKDKKKLFYFFFHFFVENIKELIKKNFKEKEKVENIYIELFKIFHSFTNELPEYIKTLSNQENSNEEQNENFYSFIESLNLNLTSKNKTEDLISNFNFVFKNLKNLKEEKYIFTIDKILDSLNSKIGLYHVDYYNNFNGDNFFFSFPNIESSDEFEVTPDLKNFHPIFSTNEYSQKNSMFETIKDKEYKNAKYKKIDENFNFNLIIKKTLFEFFPDINLIYTYQNICHTMLVLETKNEYKILDTNKINVNEIFKTQNKYTINFLTGSNCVVHSLFFAILIKYYKNTARALQVALALDNMLETDFIFVKDVVLTLFENKKIKEESQNKIDTKIMILKQNQNKIHTQTSKSFSNFLREILVEKNLANFKKDNFARLKERLKVILEKNEKYLIYALIHLIYKNPSKEDQIIQVFELIKNFMKNEEAIKENDLNNDYFINTLLVLESIYTNDDERIKEIISNMKNFILRNENLKSTKIRALLSNFCV
ncbi:hypothetical protein [Alphaproteobacteria bacterium endosymbiont of Tiliacea citrago]|uniref:hypothetical protein n=1 Tax=Alphaproteobacteria bacterium endosymbiont of Tiliacea citrago TaxID=3077944 RepID=UPI00313D7A78